MSIPSPHGPELAAGTSRIPGGSGAPLTHHGRILVRWEIALVLALSLGRSAVYALLALADTLSRGPLRGQSTALNTSQSPRPWFDLAYQLLGIAATITPAALAVLFLALAGLPAFQALGLDLGAPGRRVRALLRDLAQGFLLATCIGIPGLAIYYLGRAIGATVEVVPAALGEYWWSIPVLLLQAVKNAVIEEVIAVGYLTVRLERLGWGPRRIIVASAVLRGSYHLYQGIGPGIANLLMGLVFAEFFRRTRRTMPLIIAHTVLDTAAFVGYALLRDVISL